MGSPEPRTRSITDVAIELEDYAQGLDVEGFAPWVAGIVRFTAWLIANGRGRDALMVMRDGPGWERAGG